MNFFPLFFDIYSFQSKTRSESNTYLCLSFEVNFLSSRLHVLCLTYYLTLWVNIYVDAIHDVIAMLMLPFTTVSDMNG